MLSLEFIRANTELVRQAIQKKAVTIDLDALLRRDAELTAMQRRLEALRADKNRLAQQFRQLPDAERAINSAQSKALGIELKDLERNAASVAEILQDQLLRVPNIPWKDAPVGPDDTANVVMRQEGEPRVFDFTPFDHVQMLEKHDWAELGRVTQISGSRTYCLKGRLALLEQVLMLHVSRRMMEQGFDVLSLPALAREGAFINTGHFPFDRESAFRLPADDLYLAGTGEVILNSLRSGEILEEKELPICYAGYSNCFRREAGSAGRDVRGLLRVHQFCKVEQFVLCQNDEQESARWHEKLLSIAENFLRELELPYQVVECSTGDMGAGKFRQNDIETWLPSLGKYRETHSCSTLHDWQARRADLRYRGHDGRVRYVHTLNNTAIASPRILAPILENHQTRDGEVRLPACLRPYFNGDEFL